MGINQYASVDLTEPFYDSGINHYSSAVLTEPIYCSGVIHKKRSAISQFTESLEKITEKILFLLCETC